MADFRISNLTVRIEDHAIPKGVILGQGKFTGDLNVLAGSQDSSGGPGGGSCGCTCTCTCTCSCTCTGSGGGGGFSGTDELQSEFEDVELALLRESLKSALSDLEAVQRKKLEVETKKEG